MASITKQPKEVQERHRAMLLDLLKQPGNRECADCRGRNPTWASTNLGIFVCIRCSGLHRQVGTHVTKVKSCTMDLWDPEQIAFMARMGNARARLVWEAQLSADFGKPAETERDELVLEWIRAKYERKRYMAMDPEAVLRASAPATAGSPTTKRATGGPLRTRVAPAASTVAPAQDANTGASFTFTQPSTDQGASAFSFVAASGPAASSAVSSPALASPPPSTFTSPQSGFSAAGGFDFGAPASGGFFDAPTATTGGFDFAAAAAAPSSEQQQQQSGFAFATTAPLANAVAAPTGCATQHHVLDSLFKAGAVGNVDVFGMPLPASPPTSAPAAPSTAAPLGFMVGTATEVPAPTVPTASAPTFPPPLKVDPFAVLAQPLSSPCQAPAPFPTPASSFAVPTAAFDAPQSFASPAPPPQPTAAPAMAPSADDAAAMQRMLEQLQAQQALLMQQMQQLQLQSTA